MHLLTEFVIEQTADTNNWVKKILHNIDDDNWFVVPDVIQSSLAWQLGHLTLSQYYYTILLLAGPQKEIAENII